MNGTYCLYVVVRWSKMTAGLLLVACHYSKEQFSQMAPGLKLLLSAFTALIGLLVLKFRSALITKRISTLFEVRKVMRDK
jgi:hypothetical protein